MSPFSRPLPSQFRRAVPALRLVPLLAARPLLGQEVVRDTATLSPVVVTATRGAGGMRTAAASTTVLDGARLRAAGVRSVADALESVPGLTIGRQGSPGGVTSIFVRGGESDYVRVLVDGIPVNEPGGFLDAANLTTDDVERIEIVRGPSSVLYGSDAVSGVVQIFTRGGAHRASAARATAAFSAGTRRTRDASVSLSGLGRLGDYGVGVARHRAGGFLPLNDEFESTTLTVRASTPRDRPTTIRATLRLGDGETRYPTEFTGEASDSNSVGRERRLLGGLGVVRRVGDRAELELVATTTDVDGENEDPADSPDDPDGSTRFARDSYRRGVGARAMVRAGESATVTVGADLAWQRAWTRYDAFGAEGTPFEARRRSRGYYAQAVGDAGAALSYTAGVRWDDDEFYGGHATYRAGAGLALPRGTRLRGSLGTAFKEPTLDEASAAAAQGGRLDPERARSWEAGVEQRLADDRLVVAATWFDQRFRDLIQFVGYTPAFEALYENVAEAASRGVEAEARLRIAAPLTVGATYTHLRTEVLAAEVEGPSFAVGRPLARRPRHRAAASLELRRSGGAVVRADARWVGPRPDVRYHADFTSTRVELPSYVTVDVGGELRLARRVGPLVEPMLTARASNLLDEEYEAVAGFASPGRVVAAGLRVSF